MQSLFGQRLRIGNGASPVPPSMEDGNFAMEVKDTKEWWSSPRFERVHRPYTAEDCVCLRGTLPESYAGDLMAKKLWDLLKSKQSKGDFTHTFGALDPVQVIEMAPHLETVYVSGWQCSSTAASNNEPGPDFADYPMDTVPHKVDQLFRAQRHHDRRQHEDRCRMTEKQRAASSPSVDYLRPIIADGDTGHGGLTAVMKLTKMMIESGAAGLHLEDQKPGTKKCGHMGGKVLVSMQEHVDRLLAARLQADIMGTETIIVARTDAEAATLLDNNVDPRDHPFIVGATKAGTRALNEVIREAVERGVRGDAINNLTKKWMDEARLMRYPEVVAQAIQTTNVLSPTDKQQALQQWQDRAYKLSHTEARKLAVTILKGSNLPYFDWEVCRSREGYYRIKGGVDYCVARGHAFAPYADMLWMETAKPNIEEAAEFAKGIHKVFPGQMLAYNLSPSFNWDSAGMSEQEMASFNITLGRMGFIWQFITLAGFHSNGLISARLSREYGKHGIIKYVELVQRVERSEDVDLLTHQKWSGAELLDHQINTVTGGLASTSAMGEGVTETQFRSGGGAGGHGGRETSALGSAVQALRSKL